MDAHKLLLWSCLAMGVLFQACVKDTQDIPPGFAGDPVFGMSALIDSQYLELKAGEDLWTMVPVVTSEDSLVVYKAVLSQNGCLDQCSPSWQFSFYQAGVQDANPQTLFNETIHPGTKQLTQSDEELDSFAVTLSTHPGLFMSGYSYWQDINQQTSTFLNQFETVVGYQENINVCFQSLAYTGCQYRQCVIFDPSTLVPCLSSIEAELENPRYVSLSVRAEGTPPFQIEWYNESTSPSIVVPIRDTVAEVFAAVTVTDARGNRSELIQSVRVSNGVVDACYFPIELNSTPVPHNTDIKANRVGIVYQDEHGDLWRSDGGVQSDQAGLIIDSVTSYGYAPDQKSAYLVEARVHATLYNVTTGESRFFTTSRLSLALSHP